MMLSILNMKMRDTGCGLSELCDDEGWERGEIVRRLAEAGFEYDEAQRRFW